MKRFNLRDLFWLTLVVALVVAWWVDQRHQEQDRQTLENQLSDSMRAGFMWRAKAETLGRALTGEGWIVDLEADSANCAYPPLTHSIIPASPPATQPNP